MDSLFKKYQQHVKVMIDEIFSQTISKRLFPCVYKAGKKGLFFFLSTNPT